MKPVLFVRVAWMKYYRGDIGNDIPENGGAYIGQYGNGGECFNFTEMPNESGNHCYGFFQITGKELHLEKIPGCESCKSEDFVEDVTVFFVAKHNQTPKMRVVGYFKNATVYRHYQNLSGNVPAGKWEKYIVSATAEDCKLIPWRERFTPKWVVPSASEANQTYGFGRSNVWFAGGEGASRDEIRFVEEKLANAI